MYAYIFSANTSMNKNKISEIKINVSKNDSQQIWCLVLLKKNMNKKVYVHILLIKFLLFLRVGIHFFRVFWTK